MVRPVGIEPTTIGLKGHCSTTELQAHELNIQYRIFNIEYCKLNIDMVLCAVLNFALK